MSMTDTPERIWIDSKGMYPYFFPKEPSDSAFPVTEYIRADLCHPAPAAKDRTDAGKVEGDGCKRCGGKGEIVVGKGRHGDTTIEDCPSCSTPQDVINLVIAAQTAREQALEEEEFAIDKLRYRAIRTNSDADRQAYFDAVSKWFQHRHYRRMDAERALKPQTAAQTGGGNE